MITLGTNREVVSGQLLLCTCVAMTTTTIATSAMWHKVEAIVTKNICNSDFLDYSDHRNAGL